MAKKFYNKQDTNKQLAGEIENVPENDLKEHLETAESKQDKIPESQKRKAGRPRTKDIKNTCKNINVAVPIMLLDKWNEIKIVHGNNLTSYITKLIEKDMENNYERYKNIADSLKNI